MILRIDQSLNCSASAYIDLPIEDWSEVKDWYVKWDTLFYTLDGEIWLEHGLNSGGHDCIDWKRPESVEITNLSDGGDEYLDEQ